MLLTESTKPLILIGKSGSGKTSLIAHAASKLSEYTNDPELKSTTLILRFMGTTPSSSSISTVLIGIIRQLENIFDIENISQEANSKEIISLMTEIQLKERLFFVLNKISDENPSEKIFIFLDSLDQLNERDHNLDWFPHSSDQSYPNNVKFIFSVIEDSETLTTKLDSLFPNDKSIFLNVNELDDKESISIFRSMINDKGRFDFIKDQFRQAEITPLYIKLIYDLLSKTPSYSAKLKKIKLLYNTRRCIEFIFENLEYDYGDILVKTCLFYLKDSDKSGISDEEMIESLSLNEDLAAQVFEFNLTSDRKVPITLWNRIKYHLREYLTYKEVDGVRVYCW